MTPIVLSRLVRKSCTPEEIAYLEKHIREMVDESERTKKIIFVPWPSTKEDHEKCGNEKVEVNFFPIREGVLDRMVMILPLFDRERGENIWHVAMQHEYGRIELDIKTPLKEGHHRVTK